MLYVSAEAGERGEMANDVGKLTQPTAREHAEAGARQTLGQGNVFRRSSWWSDNLLSPRSVPGTKASASGLLSGLDPD